MFVSGYLVLKGVHSILEVSFMFSLVICTMGCLNFLRQTLEVAFNNKDVKQVIIIDNGFGNEVAAYLTIVKSNKITYLRNEINQGVIKSRNQGLVLAHGKYTIVLDDDQVPQKGNHTFNQYKLAVEKYDIVGCEPQIMDLTTGLTRIGTSNNFTYVGAGGMCMQTSLWKELGLFDEIYHPAYCEDPDLCIRANRGGYTIGVVPDHAIKHFEHRTLSRKDLGFNNEEISIRNRKIFMARYGIKPKLKKIIRPKINKDDGRIKVMHILSNINIGGVQQNAAYIAKGLVGNIFDMAIYVAESNKRGVFESQAGKEVKVFYNKKLSSRKTVKTYINTSHSPQSVFDRNGQSLIVKPGGTIPDLGYNLGFIRGFRHIDTVAVEEDISIVDAVVKYEPDIVQYHRDVSRISRDIKKLKSMPQFRQLKIVRTVHGSQLPNLSNYDVAILLTRAAMKKTSRVYPKVSAKFIPNGIDTNIFRPMPNVKKENICVTHTRLSKILKLTVRRDFYFEVVRAVCDLDKEIKFVLIGPDYALYKERFDACIKKFGLKDKLIIKDPLYNNDLVSYINKARLWFYPMSEDNFPLAVIEAMLCKLPIVSSNLTGISEMLTNHESGLLSSSNDVDTFVTNIMRCLSDTSLSNSMSEVAYNKAIETYSLSVMLRKYKEVYLDLIGR